MLGLTNNRNFLQIWIVILSIFFFISCASEDDEAVKNTIDTTPPVITINGASTVTLVQGSTYLELGATATDVVDGNITVTTTGTVDVNSANTYTIIYTATDNSNNTSTATRTVIVGVSSNVENRYYVPNKFVTATALGGASGDSVTTAWTLSEAMQNATAGNIVQVGPGIYTGNARGERYTPTFSPANSGTPGNPITFFAQFPAIYNEQSRSEIRNNGVSGDAGASPGFGASNVNYIVWDGFYIDQAQVAWSPDTGPVVLFSTRFSEIRRNLIVVRERPFYDNNSGIRIDYSSNVVAVDNRISCISTDTDPSNDGSGIILYDSEFYELAHNEISSCAQGIMPKGVHVNQPNLLPGSIHHNLFQNSQQAIQIMVVARGTAAVDQYLDIYQNIFDGNARAVYLNPIAATDARRIRIVNNTIVATSKGSGSNGSVPAADNFTQSLWQNNIFYDVTAPYGFHGGDVASLISAQGRMTYDYNRYGQYLSMVEITDAIGFSAVNELSTFVQWQALGRDISGVTGDPGFVNYSTRDLRLRNDGINNSASLSAGIDVLNLLGTGTTGAINQGAYILPDQSDVIGIRANGDNPVIVPGSVYFFDDFEYTVNRSGNNGTRDDNAFVNQGNWNAAKAVNISGSHAGYLYTVDRIPGYTGDFPGRNSNRVLAIENAAATFGTQTDFYLEYGNPAIQGPGNEVPGDAWFQFWLYINYYDDPNNIEDQLSGIDTGFKWIYPTNCGYPSRCAKWILGLGDNSYEPYWNFISPPSQDAYFRFNDENGFGRYEQPEELAGAWKLGHQDINERLMGNRWTLAKIHIDTLSANGAYEVWVKPMGGGWTKVSEWIGGVTPFFNWNIPAAERGGHRAFRMPTTVNPTYNWWMYMDDFAMATSEEGLPQYP